MTDVLKIVEPETVVRRHRSGFRQFWRWKSRSRRGRPKVPSDTRQLIREMSFASAELGRVAHSRRTAQARNRRRTTVAKYMAKRRRPPSQGWRTFLRNHADGIAAMDLFVVPTLSFRFLLYGLLILRHDRRKMMWLGVTAHPTARMDRPPIRSEACGWEQPPDTHSRPGLRLWRHLQKTSPRDGHSRQADRSTLALAEWILRTFDRLDPKRMS